MTLKEFYKKLEYAPWWYEYADDFSVHTREKAEMERVKIEAEYFGKEYLELFLAYENYIWSKGNKPEEPS